MTFDVERIVRQNATATLAVMIRDLLDHADELVELAVERATSLGAAEYGDASFHKTAQQLRRERFEEHADAIFYGCVERHNRE